MTTCDVCKALDGRDVRAITFDAREIAFHDKRTTVTAGGFQRVALDLCDECLVLARDSWLTFLVGLRSRRGIVVAAKPDGPKAEGEKP
jgi:hypothetical protein